MRSPLVLQYYARYVDIIVTIVIGLINHMALVSSPRLSSTQRAHELFFIIAKFDNCDLSAL